MIKNVIFDIGNVLVNFQPLDVMRECGVKEEDLERFRLATVAGKWWAAWDRGEEDYHFLWKMMREELTGLEEEFDRFISEGKKDLVVTLDYAKPWLQELKAQGMRVFLLSNYPKELFEIHSKDMDFLPYVDGRIVSGYVKCMKPESEIYRLLLDTYQLIPEESVFFDDLESNIRAAEKEGIHGIVFRGPEQARLDLDRLIRAELLKG